MTYRSSRSHNLVWLLIGLNIVVFIFTLVAPDTVFNLLGLEPATFTARPWTIVTNIFVHDGFSHILFNMLTFYFFGTFLLQLIGEGQFLIVYLGGGILGSLLFILLGVPYATTVGASGAIFSLGGALVVLRPRVQVMVFPIPAPMPLWVPVIIGFVLVAFIPGVAWQAHLGGIVFGSIFGYFIKRRRHYF